MRLRFLLPIVALTALAACNEPIAIPQRYAAAPPAPAPVAAPAPIAAPVTMPPAAPATACCCPATCPAAQPTVIVIREPAPVVRRVVHRRHRPAPPREHYDYDGEYTGEYAYRRHRGYVPPPAYDGHVVVGQVRREESETVSETRHYSEESYGGGNRGGGCCRSSVGAAGYTPDGYLTWPGKTQ